MTHTFHKWLFTNPPSHRKRRKIPPTIIRVETRRSICSKIRFKQIPIHQRIIDTSKIRKHFIFLHTRTILIQCPRSRTCRQITNLQENLVGKPLMSLLDNVHKILQLKPKVNEYFSSSYN